MANYVRGGAGAPRKPAKVNVTKVVSPDVTKVMAPGGFAIQPVKPNANAERGGPVGGLQDADRTAASLRQGASVGRRGQDPKAFQTNRTPSTNPPSPYPGQPGKAKPVPTAPPRLGNANVATGPASTSGESAARQKANLAHSGGALPLNPTRQKHPRLPTPTPTFTSPAVNNPGGGPNEQPAGGGSMSGVMVGGKGKKSAGNL